MIYDQTSLAYVLREYPQFQFPNQEPALLAEVGPPLNLSL